MNLNSIENVIDQDVIQNDIFLCPICGDLFENPQIDTCGHTFCQACILEFLQSARKCPISKLEQKRKDLTPNNTVRSLVLALKASCPQNRQGCSWLGMLGEIPQHLLQCDFAIVECDFECNEVVQRSQLNEHTKVCLFRPVTCQDCLEEVPMIHFSQHKKSECAFSLVECQYLCGVIIAKRFLDQHVTSECVNRFVKCPFVKFGCWFESKRQHLACHLKEYFGYHFELESDFTKASYLANEKAFTDITNYIQNKNDDTLRSIQAIKQKLSFVKMMIPGRPKINKTKLPPQLFYKRSHLKCLAETEPNTVVFLDREAQPFERVSIKICKLPSRLSETSLAVGLANKIIHKPLLNTKFAEVDSNNLVIWPNVCDSNQSEKQKNDFTNDRCEVNFRQNDVVSFYYEGRCDQIIFENLTSQKSVSMRYPSEWKKSIPVLIVSEGVELTLALTSCALKIENVQSSNS